FSPGTVLSFSPAANSVVSVSENAFDSHSISGAPVKFRKPRMATERRGCPPGMPTREYNPARSASRIATPPAAMLRRFGRDFELDGRRGLSYVGVAAASRGSVSESTISVALWNRRSGCRSRHLKIVVTHLGSRSGWRAVGYTA